MANSQEEKVLDQEVEETLASQQTQQKAPTNKPDRKAQLRERLAQMKAEDAITKRTVGGVFVVSVSETVETAVTGNPYFGVWLQGLGKKPVFRQVWGKTLSDGSIRWDNQLSHNDFLRYQERYEMAQEAVADPELREMALSILTDGDIMAANLATVKYLPIAPYKVVINGEEQTRKDGSPVVMHEARIIVLGDESDNEAIIASGYQPRRIPASGSNEEADQQATPVASTDPLALAERTN